MTNKEILVRLYKDYTSKFLRRILIAGIFSILVAGSTSSIAYLLDPAIKKIFVEKDQSLIIIIPLLIIVAFTIKGVALYFAKAIMIKVAEEIKKILQSQMVKSLINADTQLIDQKHSGKFISNLTYDVNHITNMLSTAILSLFKDSLTLFGLLFVMFYQNWKLSLIAIIMIPIAGMASKTLGKRIGKVVTEAQEKSGFLNTHLIELFKPEEYWTLSSTFTNLEKKDIFSKLSLFNGNKIERFTFKNKSEIDKAIEKINNTKFKISDVNSKIFKNIKLKEKGFSFCPEITTKISMMNINIEEFPINYIGRTYEQGKKITAFDGLDALYVLAKYRYFE